MKASQNFRMAHASGLTGLIGAMPELVRSSQSHTFARHCVDSRSSCVLSFWQGIGTAAHIHIALAAPALPHASDCCGCIYWEEDFITSPLQIEGGYAYPPQVRLSTCQLH